MTTRLQDSQLPDTQLPDTQLQDVSTPDFHPQVAWTAVCRYDDLIPERGVAALVAGAPVAVFRTHDGSLYALSNIDPFSRASVLSRGIVGDRGGRATVASPIYKQVFELATGTCLDSPDVTVARHPVQVVDGVVQVGSP